MIKILIAEDNKNLNSAYYQFLTKEKNIKVVAQSYDGKEAVKKYFELNPDLLILDLNLPKMTGLEVIEQICKNPIEKKKCNVIIISGKPEYREQLYNTAKVYMILQKPVDFDRLLKLIYDFATENTVNDIELNKSDIENLLIDFNVSPYSKNSHLLIEATMKAYNNHDLLCNNKLLYEELGKEKNTDYRKIQWSIRNSINTINNNISREQFSTFFSSNPFDKNITPTMFFVKTIQYFENNKSMRF